MSAFRIGLAVAAAFFLARPTAAEESVSYQNLLTPLLETGADIVGQPVVYPAGTPKITAAVVIIPPGGETSWHSHEVPLFVHVLDGEVTVDYGEKGTKVFAAGSTFMEAMDWPHNGMNKGTATVRILAVYMGAEGRTNAAPVEGPK